MLTKLSPKLALTAVLCALFICWNAAAASDVPWISESWQQIEGRMGPIDFDGLPKIKYNIGSYEDAGFLYRISFSHIICLDAYDHAYSSWSFTGCTSYIVPKGLKYLTALLPNGLIIRFYLNKVNKSFINDLSGTWKIRELTSGEYEVVSMNGYSYYFKNGVLVRMKSKSQKTFIFLTEGGRILEIHRSNDAGNQALVKILYNASLQISQIAIGGHLNDYFYWDNDGSLKAWVHADGSKIHFTYCNKLIVCIDNPNSPAIVMEWSPVPGWETSEHIWEAPVQLRRYNSFIFDYYLTDKGAVYDTLNEITGEKTVTTDNWIMHHVNQYWNSGSLSVEYNPALIPPGYFLKIKTRYGIVIEDYKYDKNGRLLAVIKGDEPERKLTYKQDGVLDGWDGERQEGLPH